VGEKSKRLEKPNPIRNGDRGLSGLVKFLEKFDVLDVSPNVEGFRAA
jgi:hypothetical protein